MKKLLILSIVFAFIPFVSFSQTATSAPITGATSPAVVEPGLLPGDLFYFLDRWTEAFSIVITLNDKSKARKHLEYAKERIAEIDESLKDSDVKLEDVRSAREDIDERVAKAAAIVREEKNKGNDVSGLAHELGDELDDIQDDLKDILKEHGDEFSRAEVEIRARLAALSPTDPQVQGLTQALESVTKEKMDAMREEDDLDDDLLDEQELFEEVMGKEMSAQKHIDEAMRLKARLEAMSGQLPAGVVASSQELLDQANAADLRGDFETAKKLSKQAKKMLEDAREMNDDIDDLDDDNDGIPDTKDLDDDNDGVSDAEESQDDVEIDEDDLNDLEEDIKKGDRMMNEFNR